MGTQIKEGEALIVGRGERETAVALLKAADDVGAPVESVRVVMDGFVVPAEVADKYEEAIGEDAKEVRRYEEEAIAETAAAGTSAAEVESVTDAQATAASDAAAGATVGSESITAGESGSSEGEGDKGADVPAKSASKGDWVAYAETQGYDSSEDLTKDQLIERYGVSE